MANNGTAPGDGWEIEDNLDEVETRKDVQPGRYLCRVASMEKKPTKDGSKDFFNLAFQVIDAMAPETEASIGGRVFDIFNINQAALWKLKALISACSFDSTGSRVPNLIDCEVILDAYEDTYEGRTNTKTKRYKNPQTEGWSGLHETRDASEPAAKNLANQPEKPAALAQKGNAASAGALKGKSVSTAKKTSKPDDEVEI